MTLLVGSAAAAVLLAFLFHLGVAAVVVAILGGLPVFYLTLEAVIVPLASGQSRSGRMARATPVALWEPVDLGVHHVIGGGPQPTYVRRPHDDLLRAVLDPTVAANRLVVVRGGSSTGKSRAAYQAVLEKMPDWPLDYPLTASALAERLDAGIKARTVLWLDELRDYADDDAPKALGWLAELLASKDRILVITTVWPEDWRHYTTRARSTAGGAAGLAGVIEHLLAGLPELTGQDLTTIDPGRGGVIDIPDSFTTQELERAAQTGDLVLAEAVAAAHAAGSHGQVTQYLAGVPNLLKQYEGSGGDPYGRAMIKAAIDAARLGYTSPITPSMLQSAMVGYLDDHERAKETGDWWDRALGYATLELNGAIRALEPVPPRRGHWRGRLSDR